MPQPSLSGLQVIGGVAVVSTDEENAVPVEIELTGTDLGDITDVSLDSGEETVWVISGVSASSGSVLISAYAFGGSSGSANLTAVVWNPSDPSSSITGEVYFELPLMD